MKTNNAHSATTTFIDLCNEILGPGWSAEIDDENLPIVLSRGIEDQITLHFMTVQSGFTSMVVVRSMIDADLRYASTQTLSNEDAQLRGLRVLISNCRIPGVLV